MQVRDDLIKTVPEPLEASFDLFLLLHHLFRQFLRLGVVFVQFKYLVQQFLYFFEAFPVPAFRELRPCFLKIALYLFFFQSFLYLFPRFFQPVIPEFLKFFIGHAGKLPHPFGSRRPEDICPFGRNYFIRQFFPPHLAYLAVDLVQFRYSRPCALRRFLVFLPFFFCSMLSLRRFDLADQPPDSWFVGNAFEQRICDAARFVKFSLADVSSHQSDIPGHIQLHVDQFFSPVRRRDIPESMQFRYKFVPCRLFRRHHLPQFFLRKINNIHRLQPGIDICHCAEQICIFTGQPVSQGRDFVFILIFLQRFLCLFPLLLAGPHFLQEAFNFRFNGICGRCHRGFGLCLNLFLELFYDRENNGIYGRVFRPSFLGFFIGLGCTALAQFHIHPRQRQQTVALRPCLGFAGYGVINF